MRVMAVRVPAFPVQALRRSNPDLAEAPLAVPAGPAPRDLIVAVSAEAAALGVRQGITAAQARHLAPGVVLRPAPPEVLDAAEEALADAGWSISPRMQRLGAGEIVLDAAGLTPHWGSETRLLHAALRTCRRVGLEPGAGLAGTITAARAAARTAAQTGEPVAVAPGGEAAFLAPYPISVLEADSVLVERLARWGVATAGELTRLSRAEVRLRLGPAGEALHRRAAGEDITPFLPDPPRDVLREGLLLEHPVAALEAFLFVLRGVLGRLEQRLDVRGEGFAGLALELELEGGDRREYPVALLAPTRELPAVLAMTRLHLEASPPGAPVEGVTAQVTPGRVRLVQGSLFEPPLPAPGRLAAALVRLGALAGPRRVGAPVLPDTHRPDAWDLAPFAPASIPPGDEAPPAGRPTLRALRPAREVRVVAAAGTPVAVTLTGLGGAVVASAGPYRSTGEWWTDRPWTRDDYDVLTAAGALLRLCFDRGERRWFVDGIYD